MGFTRRVVNSRKENMITEVVLSYWEKLKQILHILWLIKNEGINKAQEKRVPGKTLPQDLGLILDLSASVSIKWGCSVVFLQGHSTFIIGVCVGVCIPNILRMCKRLWLHPKFCSSPLSPLDKVWMASAEDQVKLKSHLHHDPGPHRDMDSKSLIGE